MDNDEIKTNMTKEEQEEYLKSILNNAERQPNPPESEQSDKDDNAQPGDKGIDNVVSDSDDDGGSNTDNQSDEINEMLAENKEEDKTISNNEGNYNSDNQSDEVADELDDDKNEFNDGNSDIKDKTRNSNDLLNEAEEVNDEGLSDNVRDEYFDSDLENDGTIPEDKLIKKTNIYPLPNASEIQFFDDDIYPKEEHNEDEIIYEPDIDEYYEKENHIENEVEKKPKTILDKILELPVIRDIKNRFYDKPRRFIRTFHSDYYWKNPRSRRGEITRRRMLKSGYVIVRHMWYDDTLFAYRINDVMEKGNDVMNLRTKIKSKFNRRRQVHITGQKKRYFLFDSHITPQEREKERGFTQSAQFDYLLDTSGDEQLAEQVKRQKNDRDWSPIIIIGVIMVSMVMYMMWFR